MTSETGYSYPLVSLFLDYPCAKAHEVLENWEKAKLLQGDEVDRVNLCPHCLRYNLNFREVCPQCGSGRIQEESTVHILRAGISASGGIRPGMLWICPKCGRICGTSAWITTNRWITSARVPCQFLRSCPGCFACIAGRRIHQ